MVRPESSRAGPEVIRKLHERVPQTSVSLLPLWRWHLCPWLPWSPAREQPVEETKGHVRATDRLYVGESGKRNGRLAGQVARKEREGGRPFL